MNNEEEKTPLRKIGLEDYVINCLLGFTKTDKNLHTEYGKHLTDSIAYMLSNATNRNPKMVPSKIWKKLLKRHFKHYNYN